MRIVDLVISKDDCILLRIEADTEEYRNLHGEIKDLCMFPVKLITEPVRSIKTGARHSCAKWLLLPVYLRKRYKDIDYNTIRCNCFELKDYVFFIYSARRK